MLIETQLHCVLSADVHPASGFALLAHIRASERPSVVNWQHGTIVEHPAAAYTHLTSQKHVLPDVQSISCSKSFSITQERSWPEQQSDVWAHVWDATLGAEVDLLDEAGVLPVATDFLPDGAVAAGWAHRETFALRLRDRTRFDRVWTMPLGDRSEEAALRWYDIEAVLPQPGFAFVEAPSLLR